jgi:uncharacterized protein (TIGR03435 family)
VVKLTLHRETKEVSGYASAIANFLGTAAGMPVEDHTGLTGLYDFHLEYKPNLALKPTAIPHPISSMPFKRNLD